MFWGRFLRSRTLQKQFLSDLQRVEREWYSSMLGEMACERGRADSVSQNVCVSISLTPSLSLYLALSLSLCIMKHLPSPLWEINETCLCMWASAILSSACRLPSSELWLKLKCMREVLIRGEVIWKVFGSVRKFINKSQLGFHAWKHLL